MSGWTLDLWGCGLSRYNEDELGLMLVTLHSEFCELCDAEENGCRDDCSTGKLIDKITDHIDSFYKPDERELHERLTKISNSELKEGMKGVLRLVKKHGSRSEQVRQYVQERDDIEEFVDLSATVIMLEEMRQEGQARAAGIVSAFKGVDCDAWRHL